MGYAKSTKHQFKEHMEYDGMNKDKVNPNEKHQWCYGWNPFPCWRGKKNGKVEGQCFH